MEPLDETRLILQNTEAISLQISTRAAATDSEGRFPTENIALLARQGYLGLLLPKPYGAGGDCKLFVLVVEALARACASTAWVFVVHTAASFGLFAAGSEGQRERYLPALAGGQSLAGFAATEPGTGAGIGGLQTTAEKRAEQGPGYALNGTKSFITAAGYADTFLVLARTTREESKNPKELVVMIVEKGMPGFEVGQRFESMGMRGVGWGELVFRDCGVEEGNLIADAFKVINEGGHIGMLGASAISLGISQAALDLTKRHAKDRIIAGQPLSAREGIQTMIGEMAADVEAIRQMVHFAAERNDQSPSNSYLDLLKVKIFATETAVRVVEKAMRATGAHGYSKGLPLERYYRDVRAPMLHFQALEIAKRTLGSMSMML
jgi:alkylation response protein AidB-like acyl-CoA dehydrogenase